MCVFYVVLFPSLSAGWRGGLPIDLVNQIELTVINQSLLDYFTYF